MLRRIKYVSVVIKVKEKDRKVKKHKDREDAQDDDFKDVKNRSQKIPKHDESKNHKSSNPNACDSRLIPKADRKAIHEYLFREGVLVAKKDFNQPKHGEIDTKNLFVGPTRA